MDGVWHPSDRESRRSVPNSSGDRIARAGRHLCEPADMYQSNGKENTMRTNGKENTMRAVTVTEYGATPAVAEVPTPEPGPGQVLIKLRAAGMNPMDRTLASGAWKPMPATFPMVLGADGAGVVEQLGEGASRFSVGDDLFGQLLIAPLGSAGTYAEYVAVTRGCAAGTGSQWTR